jgi:hypothetical protein
VRSIPPLADRLRAGLVAVGKNPVKRFLGDVEDAVVRERLRTGVSCCQRPGFSPRWKQRLGDHAAIEQFR